MEQIYGITAGVLGIIGAAAYIRDTYLRKTLPHRFAWFIFLIISIVSFASQAALGAQASLYYMGWFVINNVIIFSLSLRKNGGYGDIEAKNVVSLCIAVVGIVLWKTLSSPLLALLFVIVADAIGTSIIVIKSYKHPHTETLTMWALGIVASALTMLSVGKWDFALLAMPFYGFVFGVLIVGAILAGKGKMAK